MLGFLTHRHWKAGPRLPSCAQLEDPDQSALTFRLTEDDGTRTATDTGRVDVAAN